MHITRDGMIYNRPWRPDRWGRCPQCKSIGKIEFSYKRAGYVVRLGRRWLKGSWRLLADAKAAARRAEKKS